MEYTQFGRTEARVSRIGFGGAPAGLKNYLGKYNPLDLDDRNGIISAVQKALELGINYFDTAQSYGNGEGESIFGEALKGVKRDEIFLATKISSSDNVRNLVEESLERLKVSYIDLLQIHGGSYREQEVEFVLREGGVLDKIYELKREGLIRFVGFTTEDNNDAVYSFIESSRFDSIQMRYNLLCQHPYYEPKPIYDKEPVGSMNLAEKQGMGIATMRTLTSGAFQRWMSIVNPEDRFDYNKALLQFVLSNPLVDTAIIGMRSVEEVVYNVQACDDSSGRIDLDKLYNRFV